jgi:hypothetical protein
VTSSAVKDTDRRLICAAEARQDGSRVPSKGRAGADNEYVVSRQRVEVIEQEPRNPVQRDGGLPGARSTLNHEQFVERRPDEIELGGLDSSDDVLHLTSAITIQILEQGIVWRLQLRHRGGELPENHITVRVDRVAGAVEASFHHQAS